MSKPSIAAGGSGVRSVKSAAHTVEVLEFLAAQSGPTAARDISEALDIPRSSLYALLRTLTAAGWVRRDRTGTLYSVGIRTLMTGMSYLDADPYLQMVHPWLRELNERLDETVHLGRLDGADIVYLTTQESSQYHRAVNRVGRWLPASATALGKSILAERGDDALTRHVHQPLRSLTPHTITDLQDLRAELELTRARGYAIDLEENMPGVKCFGFALHYTIPVLDAISCSVPVNRLTPEREREIIDAMSDAVITIERHVPRSL
jgi:DNA-binding IclR family transcriptional regulator